MPEDRGRGSEQVNVRVTVAHDDGENLPDYR
jgi:hypothetical protein